MASSSSYVYCVDDHHLNSCRQIDELWHNREFCDVNLIAENADGKVVVSLPAHRVVLAANIPYFRAMLTSHMQEASQRDITLKNVDSDGLKRIVGYAYSGKLEITEHSSQGVLATASLLGLPDIVSACVRYIGKRLSAANCLGVAEFGRLHELESLVTMAGKYAYEHFVEVAKHEEFLDMSVERLEEFVASDEISVRAEEEVYEAVTRWIQHDPEDRKEYIDQLYRHVRFPILSHDFLNKVAFHNDLLTSTPSGKIMLQDARDYHLNPATAISLNPKKIQPRSSVAGVICVAGGTGNSGQSLSDVSFFNAHKKVWKVGTKMQARRNRLALALYRGELYAIGGMDITEPLATVEKYSPHMNSWRNVASLNAARRSCAAIVTKAGIFVLGGFSGSVFLKSVEFYDASLDEWQYQQPMQSSRSELASVFLDQRIYAVGGINTHGQLRSVERFDLINRKWENIADMCIARANCGMSHMQLFSTTCITDICIVCLAKPCMACDHEDRTVCTHACGCPKSLMSRVGCVRK